MCWDSRAVSEQAHDCIGIACDIKLPLSNKYIALDEEEIGESSPIESTATSDIALRKMK